MTDPQAIKDWLNENMDHIDFYSKDSAQDIMAQFDEADEVIFERENNRVHIRCNAPRWVRAIKFELSSKIYKEYNDTGAAIFIGNFMSSFELPEGLHERLVKTMKTLTDDGVVNSTRLQVVFDGNAIVRIRLRYRDVVGATVVYEWKKIQTKH